MSGSIGDQFTNANLGPALTTSDGTAKIPRIGNWTVWAEWNVLADPEAAQVVLAQTAGLEGKITLVTLDLTHQVLATPEARDLLLHGPREAAARMDAEYLIGMGEGKSRLRTMLVELLMFFAKKYRWVTVCLRIMAVY